MIIRELLNLLGLEINEASFEEAEEAIVSVEKVLAGIAAAGAAAALAISNLVEHVTSLDRGSKLIGVGRDMLQEWGYAAKATGADFDNFVESVLDLEDKISDVATGGGKEYAELLQKIGIHSKDLKDSTGKLRSMEELLPMIADGFHKMAEGTERSGVASRLLGETGAKTLLPMFAGGSAGMREMAAEARALGIVLDTETIEATLAFRREWGKTTAALEGVVFSIAAALLPGVQDVVLAIREWIAANREFISYGVEVTFRAIASAARIVVQFTEPMLKLFKVLVVDLGLGRVAFYGLVFMMLFYAGNAVRSAIASTVAFVASMIAKITVTETYTSLLGVTTTKLRLLSLAEMQAAVTGAAAPYLIAAAWGALVLILVGLIEDIYTFFQGGDSLIGRLGQWIADVFTIHEDDNGLVKFLKWLGMFIFDIQGFFIILGHTIAKVFYGSLDIITAVFKRLEKFLQDLFYGDLMKRAGRAIADVFLSAGRSILDFFTGIFQWLLGKMQNLAQFWGKLLTGDFKGALGAGMDYMGGVGDWAKQIQWTDNPDSTLGHYLGPGATPAGAIQASAGANVSNASNSIYAPNQRIDSVTVQVGGTNATPAEITSAVSKGVTSPFQDQLQNGQVSLAGGGT